MSNQLTAPWAPPDSKSYFLALPFVVRRQIYYAAGLGKHQNCWPSRIYVDMNFHGALRKQRTNAEFEKMSEVELQSYQFDKRNLGWLGPETAATQLPRRFDPDAEPLPLNLLHVCHSMHDEVEKIFLWRASFHDYAARSRWPTSARNLKLTRDSTPRSTFYPSEPFILYS